VKKNLMQVRKWQENLKEKRRDVVEDEDELT
jgi:hypothetical protein